MCHKYNDGRMDRGGGKAGTQVGFIIQSSLSFALALLIDTTFSKENRWNSQEILVVFK